MSLATFSFLMGHPLARRHRVRAVARWVGWQAWSRTVGRPLTVRFAGDARLLVAPGMTGAAGLLGSDAPLALVVELNGSGARYGFDEETLHADLLAQGFEPHGYSPFERRLASRGQGRSSEGNTLYLRQPEVFATRVAGAPGVRVFGELV